MTDRVCADCALCNRTMRHGSMCLRRDKFDKVNGFQTDAKTCESERSRLWRWLGSEVCGPEAKYFVKREIRAAPLGPRHWGRAALRLE